MRHWIYAKNANAKNLKREKAAIHARIPERSAAATSRPENACKPVGGQFLSPQRMICL